MSTLMTPNREDKSGAEDRPVAAWAADKLAAFPGASITYLKGLGIERGVKGDEGVVAVQRSKE